MTPILWAIIAALVILFVKVGMGWQQANVKLQNEVDLLTDLRKGDLEQIRELKARCVPSGYIVEAGGELTSIYKPIATFKATKPTQLGQLTIRRRDTKEILRRIDSPPITAVAGDLVIVDFDFIITNKMVP